MDIQKEVREVRKPGIVYAKEVPMIKVKQVKEINGKGTPLQTVIQYWTNGIPDDYVEMYLEEAIPSLCDSTSAAIGKIDVECMKLKPKELMLDWVEYIKGLCMENEMIAHQVRKKGKTLQGCMAVLLEYSFKNQITVDKTIIKAAGVSAGKVTFGVPGMAKAKELIRDYYMGGTKA